MSNTEKNLTEKKCFKCTRLPMIIRFCLCFGMGCTPSMLSESNRSRKNSDIYTNNGTGKEIIHQDATKCNPIMVNPYSGDIMKNNAVPPQQEKKDSIVSMAAVGNFTSFTVIPTVRRSTIGSKYLILYNCFTGQ